MSSTPAANASLVEAPDEVSITFSEPIDPATTFVDVVDAQQRVIAGVGPPRVSDDGLLATVSLPRLEPGVYTVTYQVVSTVDGHATAGIFAFLVDPAGTEAPPALTSGSRSPSVDAATIAARWLSLAALIVALGSIITWWNARHVVTGSARHPPWPVIAVAGGLAFVGTALYLGLAARPIVDALGPEHGTGIPLDFAAPFGWSPFSVAMRVSGIASLLAGATALGLTLARRRATDGRHHDHGFALAVAAALAIALAGMSMAGHAASTGGPAFAAMDWVHLVAVAAWLGGLPAAFVLARRAGGHHLEPRAALIAILRRHGRVALVAVPLVVLTGIANSPLVLGESRDLVASDYGNLVLAKAGLLSVAVGIGAVNHLALRGAGRARVALLVGAELGIAVLAVSVAATMVTIQPAASRQAVLTAPPVNPAHLYGEVGPSSIHATVSVPAPGNQSYQVTVSDRETGAPRDDVQKVFLQIEPPADASLTGGRVELDSDPRRPGLFGISGAYTPIEGEWTLDVVVRRAGARDESVSFALPVTSSGTPRPAPPPDTGIGVPGVLAATWTILPDGPLGWLPAGVALAGLWISGRRRWLARGMRTATRTLLLAVLLVAAFGAGSRALVATANAPSGADLAGEVPDPAHVPSAERGEALYLANCASCHGRDGDGDGPVATLPDAGGLPEAVARMSPAELSYRIANGLAGTPMPAFAASLTYDERWDLVRYLQDRWN